MQALDFNSSGAASIINNWCVEKTNGRIQNLIGSTIPDDMMMYLVNALYFKSQWQMDIKYMVAVLPSINMNINQLLDYLDSEKLQNAVKNMRWQKVWLKLPRFKIESGFSLARPVRDLGIK